MSGSRTHKHSRQAYSLNNLARAEGDTRFSLAIPLLRLSTLLIRYLMSYNVQL